MSKTRTVHHRKPRSRMGDDSMRNTSVVTSTKHRAWHTLFSNMLPHQIAEEINEVWIDPDFIFIVKRRE